jgi:bifunctional oligoribonuclease and PAP phosphatase NrnA
MDDIVAFIKEHQRFALASHINPDGDSIGSLLALTLGLRALGKKVDALSADPVPFAYCRLPGVSLIQRPAQTSQGYDGAVLLECSRPERAGMEGLDLRPWIIIDHHLSCRPEGLLNWIDPSYGATGQMILRLLEALGVRITPDIATNLYAALLTDTGSFQFNNTTPRELHDAARLAEYGANPSEIAEMVYNANQASKVLLMGKVLSQLHLEAEGRIAWVVMDRLTMEAAGALPEDTEGIIQHLMSIHTVQLAAFFKQDGELSRFRVSLRSKGFLDVSAVAQRFSGGGHRNAAGFTVHQTLERGIPFILETLNDFMQEKS